MSQPADRLPPLPLTEWEPAKITLHLWTQIVGKIKLATSPPRNHWWHVPLYVDVRGMTTRRLHAPSGITFEIVFDFVDHRLGVLSGEGAEASFEGAGRGPRGPRPRPRPPRERRRRAGEDGP